MILVLSEIVLLIALFFEKKFNKLQKKDAIILSIVAQIVIAVYLCLYLFVDKNILYSLYSITGTLCVFIAYTDIKEKMISLYYCAGIVIVGIIFSFLRTDTVFFNPMITGIVFFLLMKVAKKISKSQIGDGDVYLITAYSVVYGYPQIVTTMFCTLFISLIFGVIGVIVKKLSMKTEIPFAPFMLVGGLFLELIKLV